MSAEGNRSGSVHIDGLNAVLASIKKLATDAVQQEKSGFSNEQWETMSSLMLKVKATNRSLFTEQFEKRSAAEDARSKVDAEKLRLENLLYKQQYLLREIQSQREIETPSLSKIEAEVGKKFTVDSAVDIKRSHKRAISSLDEEKNLRVVAKAKLDNILNNVKRINEVGVKKKKFLDSIPIQAEVLIDSLKDLQSRFKAELASQGVSSSLNNNPSSNTSNSNNNNSSTITPAIPSLTIPSSHAIQPSSTIPVAPTLSMPH